MRRFINNALRATQKYTIWDFGFLKAALLSLGILIGSYFAEFFLAHTLSLWIIFLVSYLWILYRTFITHKE